MRVYLHINVCWFICRFCGDVALVVILGQSHWPTEALRFSGDTVLYAALASFLAGIFHRSTVAPATVRC